MIRTLGTLGTNNQQASYRTSFLYITINYTTLHKYKSYFNYTDQIRSNRRKSSYYTHFARVFLGPLSHGPANNFALCEQLLSLSLSLSCRAYRSRLQQQKQQPVYIILSGAGKASSETSCRSVFLFLSLPLYPSARCRANESDMPIHYGALELLAHVCVCVCVGAVVYIYVVSLGSRSRSVRRRAWKKRAATCIAGKGYWLCQGGSSSSSSSSGVR